MAALLSIKDSIRDFLRKYDEIATPVFRFIGALAVFISINAMFGYSDLFNKPLVVILISVLCALLSDGFMFFVAGIVMAVHSFCVSVEVGAVFVVLFIAIYCLYVRFFPKFAYVVLMVPIFWLMHLYGMTPLIVAIVAGIGGIIPMAFGVILYYFSVYAQDVSSLLASAADSEEVQAFSYVIEALLKNKEMLMTIGVFAVTVLITYIIYRMSFDYSWYIAIAAGGIANIILFLLAGFMMDMDVPIMTILLNSVIGMVIAVIIQFCKGFVDYSHTEIVQFEDDDFYYYVKAIPKLNVASSKMNVKKVNSGERD